MTPILTALLCLGTLPKPTIWAEPGSVIPMETSVTLWCKGSLKAQKYVLYKDGYPETWEEQKPLEPKDKAKFPITDMTSVYAGRYHCYYESPTGWSEPSDQLELVVTGAKPTQVLPSGRRSGPVVTSGQNLTLQCLSDVSYDRFALFKEGTSDLLQLHGRQTQAGFSGADFSLSPVKSSRGGQYTCYGGHNLSSQWSAPSDPLDILVTGEEPWVQSGPRLHRSLRGTPGSGPSWYLYVLIGASVAFILMLCLLILLLVRQQRRGKCRKSSKKGLRHPRGGGALWADPGWAQGSGQREPREVGKADVGHFHRISSQRATASDAPPDVTYAQLNHLTLRQKTSASSPSQSGEPPAEPSVYAALAIH
uniref:Immunoglobulin-like beta-sandwich domain-containing protein n=1 Tax=Canis lupus dingo TaxID=286419 RepID=A0A8C0KWJ0_CANLU